MIAPSTGPGRSPSATLPLRYMVTAAAAFVLAALGVAWLAVELGGHYYHPRIVALAHTVTLGWITLTIMGASYQLIPIVLERPIWSERLARWQFVFLATGIVGMVAHFVIGQRSGLVWAAGVVAAGSVIYLVNVSLSLRSLTRWTFTARLMVMAFVGLGLTLVFGLLLGADRVWRFLPGAFFPTLHAHFHLALLGWVTPIVIGVSARVYPMFLLAPEPGGRLGQLQFWGLAVGGPAVVLGLLGAPALVIPGSLAVAGALGGHAAWVLGMARSRKRPALDWGLRFVLTGSGFLLPATGLGLGLALDLVSGPRTALAYAVLALGGWISLTIVGMMLKIVPFLVWYRVYGPRVGRAQVPTLAQLSWPVAEGLAYVLLVTGVVVLAAAVLVGDVVSIRAASTPLVLGALAFAAALSRVLHHLAPRTDGQLSPAGGVRTP